MVPNPPFPHPSNLIFGAAEKLLRIHQLTGIEPYHVLQVLLSEIADIDLGRKGRPQQDLMVNPTQGHHTPWNPSGEIEHEQEDELSAILERVSVLEKTIQALQISEKHLEITVRALFAQELIVACSLGVVF